MSPRSRSILKKELWSSVVALALLAAPAGAATFTSTPTADGYVRSDQPSANFGTSTRLYAQTGSPVRHAYLRFAAQVPAGEVVTKATLRIFSLPSAGGDSVALHGVADDTWSETGLAWDNAPAFAAADADTASGFGKRTWISLDATSLVSGSGPASMALATTGPSTLGFSSRDASNNRPQLVVETSPASGSPPPVDTTPPAAPTGVSASVGDGSVALKWTPNGETDLSGYRVYRRNGDGTWPSIPTGVTTSASWTDSGLTDGTSYTYRVTAVDTSNNQSTPSAQVSATPAAPSSSSGPCGRVSAPAGWQHVVWVVFENHSYSEIIGSSSAPYLNGLAKQCGLATNFTAEAHPSLPNYIAMTSGSTQGISDDNGPSSHPLNVASIFSLLPGGKSRSLQESMPSNCATSSSGSYAVKHNPEAYYTNLGSDCANYDVPLTTTPNISAKFTFVTPNLCNDMHDCSVQTGDTWLSNFLPKILASTEYQSGSTAVFITWDEDDNSASQHIPTLVVSPSTPAGATTATALNHYSMLRTTEEMLGLTPLLGNAANAPSMRSALGL